jgi:hypothetical protein
MRRFRMSLRLRSTKKSKEIYRCNRLGRAGSWSRLQSKLVGDRLKSYLSRWDMMLSIIKSVRSLSALTWLVRIWIRDMSRIGKISLLLSLITNLISKDIWIL